MIRTLLVLALVGFTAVGTSYALDRPLTPAEKKIILTSMGSALRIQHLHNIDGTR